MNSLEITFHDLQMSAVDSNQPVGVELKPATFFPLNRSEMCWQGVTRGFLGKSRR
jgi:hypothetical protein